MLLEALVKMVHIEIFPHKRNNKIIQKIDLYDLLIHGDLKLDNQLRSGDVFIVHPRLNHVRVSGGFANPAIYD